MFRFFFFNEMILHFVVRLSVITPFLKNACSYLVEMYTIDTLPRCFLNAVTKSNRHNNAFNRYGYLCCILCLIPLLSRELKLRSCNWLRIMKFDRKHGYIMYHCVYNMCTSYIYGFSLFYGFYNYNKMYKNPCKTGHHFTYLFLKQIQNQSVFSVTSKGWVYIKAVSAM